MRASPTVSSNFISLSAATGGVAHVGIHGFQTVVTPTAGGRYYGTYDTGNTVSIEL